MPLLMRFENSPGQSASAPSMWPQDSPVSLSSDCFTVLMFAHPQCPCTRASIAELAELAAGHKFKIKPYVLVFSPQSKPQYWDRTDNIDAARRIAGVTVIEDLDGKEANRFHCLTSGQTLVYDSGGELLFSGGITGARGQTGVNRGLQVLVTVLDGTSRHIQTAHVFGCSLHGDQSVDSARN